MNVSAVRLKKEGRALFWPWCAVMTAGALPLLHLSHPFLREGIPLLGFLVGIPLLAALAFGNEFQHRTLSLLLSQPAGRMEIWREKLVVTAVAVASAAWLFWYGSRPIREEPAMWLVGIGVMAATASTPFFSLLARSTIGGLALLLIPQFVVWIIVGIIYGFDNPPPAEAMPALSIAALGYAGVMLWLGARKLARFQVTGGLPGDDLLLAGPDVMPEALAGWFRYRPTEPLFNLIRKELRLLRTLWLVSLPVVLYMTFLTVFRLFPDFHGNRRITEGVFLLSPLAFIPVMGILAGCLSLAEERTSGTHSWHLTLPVSARRQWLIKLLVAVFSGFVCAVLLPVLVLFAGGNLSYEGPVGFVDPRYAVEWMITVPLLTLLSFWCACAVNGTVRAALWVFPVSGLIYLAAGCGDLMGQELAQTTGTLRDFVVSWFQLNPLAQTSIAMQWPNIYLFKGPTLLWLFVPVLLLAVIQSYRLFRTQPQDSALWMLRCLMPLAAVTILWSFSLSAGFLSSRWAPLYETRKALDKLQPATAKLELTGEDLAKNSPVTALTRRWLRGSSITVAPDHSHSSGYRATIHLASGLECRVRVPPYGATAASCAYKGP